MPHPIPGNREKFIERRNRAWELRKAGASYRAIARELGVSRDTAHKDVTREALILISRTQETAEEARKLDTERLDSMLLAIAPKIREGNIAAIGQGVRILERRAKMFGYDAPQQVEVAAVIADASSPEVTLTRVREQLLRLVSEHPVIDITPIAPQLGEPGGNGHGHGPVTAST